MPRKGKSKGKGSKGKGKGKGMSGKGKGQTDGGMGELVWGPTLGQLQHQWCPPYGSDQYGGDLCAITADGWQTVRGGSKMPSVKLSEQMEKSPNANRFSLLAPETPEDEDDFETVMEQWPAIEHEKEMKTMKANSKMPKMPRKARRVTFGGDICMVGSDANGLSFDEHAMMVRERCKAERLQARANETVGVVLYQDKPINAMPQKKCDRTGEWQKLELTVDSGAAETVIPHDMIIDHEIKETEMSAAGVCYASATGQPIPNLGEQRLPLMTSEGTMRGMKCQAAPVARPLGSVKRMCGAGHQVVFDADGSYVRNKRTGEINWMREENGNFIMDLWVMPAACLQERVNNNWGFHRQP